MNILLATTLDAKEEMTFKKENDKFLKESNSDKHNIRLFNYKDSSHVVHKNRFSKIAFYRNRLMDKTLDLLDKFDKVVFYDYDLCGSSKFFMDNLFRGIGAETIVAPKVLIDNSEHFYDVDAFIDHKGFRFDYIHPWTNTRPRGHLLDMSSVGTCFSLPKSVIENYRYDENVDNIEHISFFNKLKKDGYKIVMNENASVYHTDLIKKKGAYN